MAFSFAFGVGVRAETFDSGIPLPSLYALRAFPFVLAPPFHAAVEVVVVVVFGEVVGLPAVEVLQAGIVDAVCCAANGIAEVGVRVLCEEGWMGKGEEDVGRRLRGGFGGDEEAVYGGACGDDLNARCGGRHCGCKRCLLNGGSAFVESSGKNRGESRVSWLAACDSTNARTAERSKHARGK